MRRARISIPSNIAEGLARKSPNEFDYISKQKAKEMETTIIESRKQIYALINSIAR